MTLTRSFLMFRGQENNFSKFEATVVSEMPTLISEVSLSPAESHTLTSTEINGLV